MIRNLRKNDIEKITSTYNDYIKNTIITFEEEQLTSVELERRINANKLIYPWLVSEKNNEIIGYAYASKFKERSAYRYSAETTIYLDKNSIGNGLGRLLYSELLALIDKTRIESRVWLHSFTKSK